MHCTWLVRVHLSYFARRPLSTHWRSLVELRPRCGRRCAFVHAAIWLDVDILNFLLECSAQQKNALEAWTLLVVEQLALRACVWRRGAISRADVECELGSGVLEGRASVRALVCGPATELVSWSCVLVSCVRLLRHGLCRFSTPAHEHVSCVLVFDDFIPCSPVCTLFEPDFVGLVLLVCKYFLSSIH